MRLRGHVTQIWLLPCGWLLTFAPGDSTYVGQQLQPPPVGSTYVDQQLQPPPDAWASCQVDTGSDLDPAGQRVDLQLTVCEARGRAETFMFNATMLERWRACFCSAYTTSCKVTARHQLVVDVTQKNASTTSMNIPFLCDQPNIGTMLCERRYLAFSDFHMFVSLHQCPYVVLTWNSNQTTVSARCHRDIGLYFYNNSHGRSCSLVEVEQVTDKVNWTSNRTATAATNHVSAHLSKNAVIGIVVACVVILVILLSVIALYLMRRRRQHSPASSRSSVQSTTSPGHKLPEEYLKKTKQDNRQQPHAASSGHESMGGNLNAHRANGRSGQSNNYTNHSSVSRSGRTNNNVSTVDDHTYASIDDALRVNSAYMGLDATTDYNHTYKTLIISDPNLRPPTPLPLHVSNQPLPYYSAAVMNDVDSTNRNMETVSGQYVELTEDITTQNVSTTKGDYLVPVSMSPYRTGSTQQSNSYVSLMPGDGTSYFSQRRH